MPYYCIHADVDSLFADDRLKRLHGYRLIVEAATCWEADQQAFDLIRREGLMPHCLNGITRSTRKDFLRQEMRAVHDS